MAPILSRSPPLAELREIALDVTEREAAQYRFLGLAREEEVKGTPNELLDISSWPAVARQFLLRDGHLVARLRTALGHLDSA